MFVIKHQLHGALAHCRGNLFVVVLLTMAPTFSGVGVTGKPGAVQLQERRAKLVGGMAVARR